MPADRDKLSRSHRTPPLAWVRAFCAAAQYASFAEAADALHLSPSTISHEIRKLEAWIGQPLFARLHRKVVLTAAGAQLFATLQPAFAQIDAAFARFASSQDEFIRIGALPFFASEFLLPTVQALSASTTNLSVALMSDNHLAALDHVDPTQRPDAVVRYSTEPPPGYHSMMLTDVTLALVTAAHDLDAAPSSAVRTIKLQQGFNGWQTLQDAGFSLPESQQPPVFVDNFLSGMLAVEQGIGIGIALLPLCEPWLTGGRMRLYSPRMLPIPERYWLTWRADSAKSSALQIVGEKLQAELAERKLRVAQLAVKTQM